MCFFFLFTVLIIKGVRESTLSVGKSRARNPTQNPTQKPTPNRPATRTRPSHTKTQKRPGSNKLN